MKGMEDIVVCICGKFLAIEAKIGNNKQSEDQIEREREVRYRGQGFYTVCRSKEDLILFLKQNGLLS